MNRFSFTQLLTALPSPHMVLDLKLNYVAANPAYVAAVGRAETDLVGRNLFDLFPNEGAEGRRLRESIARVIATGRPDTLAYIHYRIPAAGTQGGFEDRYWSAVHSPLLDEDGQVAFVLQNTVDITELVRLREVAALPFQGSAAEVALVERAREAETAYSASLSGSTDFRRLFQQSPSMVAVLQGASHIVTFANDTLQRFMDGRELVGLPARQILPQAEQSGLFAAMDEVWQSGEAVAFEAQALVLPNGRSSYVDVSLQPIRDTAGRTQGIFVQAADRTEAVRAGERQRLLLDELNHRVKNTLSAVQSIARQSLFGGKPLHLARETFENRIRALSLAHNALSARHWEAVDLSVILEQELAMHDSPGRIVCQGPHVLLDSKPAIAMALVLHELSSNAGKYGALSRSDGQLVVEWRRPTDGGLELIWRETGGIGGQGQIEDGFGMRMLRRIVEGELDGTLEISATDAQYICRIKVRSI
ncbi:sensor histidine kinase [Aureimonas frigidaquae]|uniref:sensor histidine kinase n=1 Tax=Aureimonas frigidaquae TaxID=424757 RepID=UPI000AEF0EBA|nr:PAS domain-containing protein [Aureimonas frigidaquae]